jgi:hypothetical protein
MSETMEDELCGVRIVLPTHADGDAVQYDRLVLESEARLIAEEAVRDLVRSQGVVVGATETRDEALEVVVNDLLEDARRRLVAAYEIPDRSGALMDDQMTETSEPEIGRVRQFYLDFHNEGPYPRRGDEISSEKNLYLVLSAKQVKRRGPHAGVRIQMRVIRAQDIPEGLPDRLYRSASRGRGKSMRFSFTTWYKR